MEKIELEYFAWGLRAKRKYCKKITILRTIDHVTVWGRRTETEEESRREIKERQCYRVSWKTDC